MWIQAVSSYKLKVICDSSGNNDMWQWHVTMTGDSGSWQLTKTGESECDSDRWHVVQSTKCYKLLKDT